MPRPALTDEQRKATRRLIRRAAAELYAENGSVDISARKIAERAGVSVGSLYTYFENLTELMQSLWKEPVIRLIQELEATQTSLSSPLDKLQHKMETYVKFAREEHAVYRGAFLYVRPDSHKKPIQVSLDDDRLFRLFRDSIQEAQEQGLVRDGDLNALAQTVWSALHGAVSLPINVDRLALAKSEVASQQMVDAMLEWLQK
tara:strand:- start:13476 stop:14081 length:606 start_codon:yes stop_codon:yes gene_type:complete